MAGHFFRVPARLPKSFQNCGNSRKQKYTGISAVLFFRNYFLLNSGNKPITGSLGAARRLTFRLGTNLRRRDRETQRATELLGSNGKMALKDRCEVVPQRGVKMAIDDPAASDWCNLSWTQWQPLETDFVRAFAPVSSGVYRIRRAGLAKRLTYIGQTSRTLRERLLALANLTHAEQCPFNDPHTAAPYLWLMARLDRAQLEFSCASVIGDRHPSGGPWLGMRPRQEAPRFLKVADPGTSR